MELSLFHFVSREGTNPYGQWFAALDAAAASKVQASIARLQQGNTSNVKGVGGGVFELKIAFGPGYRVYFGKHGQTAVILLGGGTKQRQARDIAVAHMRWTDYKQRV